MLLQEPTNSQYDLQFRLFQFPVRVTWSFWLAAAVLGWNFCYYMQFKIEQQGLESPPPFILLIVWAAAIFLSILVHELGHAFAMRYFGGDAKIVLYHFGGLAIPNFGAWNAGRRRRNDSPQAQFLISAAGPAAQLVLGIVAWAVAIALRLDVDFSNWILGYIELPIAPPKQAQSGLLLAFFDSLISPSIFWVFLNIVPVLPLDGGQMLRSALRIWGRGDTDRVTLIVSMVSAALVAFWGYQGGQPGVGIMFMFLAISSYQALQAYSRGPW